MRWSTTAAMAWLLIGARRSRLGGDGTLTLGGGALRGDCQDALDLGAAAEGIGVLGDHLDELGHELRERYDLVCPEVDEPLGDPVTLGPPSVLADQEPVVDAPALIAYAQPPEHPQQALRDGGQGERRPQRAARRP